MNLKSIRRFFQKWCLGLLSRRRYFLARCIRHREIDLNTNVFLGESWSMATDSVRTLSVCLLKREIEERNVEGSIAELGVFEGDFAKVLNALFPSRTLFLFDTFSGFQDEDVEYDRELSYSKVERDFSRTSKELVLSRLPNKDKVKIVEGHFPLSTKNVSEGERFALVNIDADLYKPIYEGLMYFYERLSPGGYIVVHDFNNHTYQGSKAAVRSFCEKMGACCVPIPDAGGSVILSKPIFLGDQGRSQ